MERVGGLFLLTSVTGLDTLYKNGFSMLYGIFSMSNVLG